jgi:hypothetical protein
MLREFKSFAEAAAHCAELALVQHEADHRSLVRATDLLQKKAKDKIGQYQPEAGEFVAWAELAESTKQDRERQGYPENEPLLRVGILQESIETLVLPDEGLGYVGSNSDIAVWQELGTTKIPPRSFLGSTAVENLEAIVNIVGETSVVALVGKAVFEGHIDIKGAATKDEPPSETPYVPIL